MVNALKSWWRAKNKSERIYFFVAVGVTLVMLIFTIVYFVVLQGPIKSAIADTEAARKAAKDADTVFVETWGNTYWIRVVQTIFYLCLFVSLGVIARALIFILFITADNKVKTITRLINSFLKYASILAFIFVALIAVWKVKPEGALTIGGIITLVIGLGAQSLISDIIAGINIVFENEFHVGDIVLVDGFRGSVKEIGVTTTKIIDVSGNVKTINNSKIATVVNLSENSSIVVAEIGMDYGEDLRKVEKIIDQSLPMMEQRNPCFIGKPVYLGVSALADSSVNLKFSVRCEEGNRFNAERALNRELFLMFCDNGITVPFPQITLSQRDDENKENKQTSLEDTFMQDLHAEQKEGE